jgi:hypothetical protein
MYVPRRNIGALIEELNQAYFPISFLKRYLNFSYKHKRYISFEVFIAVTAQTAVSWIVRSISLHLSYLLGRAPSYPLSGGFG